MAPQNRFQFGLKDLFWGAFSGAVIAAVAAAFVLRMNPAQTRSFAALLAAGAAGFVAARIYRFFKGQRIATAAGQFISEWPALAPPIVLRAILLVYLALVVIGAGLGAYSTASISQIAPNPSMLVPYCVAIGGNFVVAIMYGGLYGFFFHGGGKLTICEHGIVLDNRLFIPWSDIESFSWNNPHSRNKVRFSLRRCAARSKVPRLHRRKSFRVPAAMCDQFEALLTANGVACER